MEVRVADGINCRVSSCIPIPKYWPRTRSQAARTIRLAVHTHAPDGEGWQPMDRHASIGAVRLTGSSSLECAVATDSDRVFEAAFRLSCLLATRETGGVLLHATGLLGPDGRAVVALAPSGGGKSTLTDLATGFDSLSDETVLVETENGLPVVHGCSFRSAANKQPTLASGRLAAMLILEKSPIGSFERTPLFFAAKALVNQAYGFCGILGPTLGTCRRLTEAVPAYRFRFPKSSVCQSLLVDLLDEESIKDS